MNIFYLDESPKRAAADHCDKHVGKMLIETCQLLAAAQHLCGGSATYKLTHQNHPCAKWVRESKEHYGWLVELGLALGDEFEVRYGKRHKSGEVLKRELLQPPAALGGGFQPPPLAMPDEFRRADHVQAYRDYYHSKQAAFVMAWKTAKPAWWQA